MNNEFEIARNQFVELCKKQNNKPFEKIAESCITDEGVIEAAVKLAYKDAQRTMKGIGKYSTNKDKAIKGISEKLEEYFNGNACENADKFDEKHKELCDKWKWHNEKNERKENFPNSNLGTYGKAQKIVNMAFKYLYCCKDACEKEDYFKYCHVPLDTFTLEWFCRECRDKIVKSKIASWSLIAKYDLSDENKNDDNEKKYYNYMFFQEKFIEMYSENELTPLQAEFIKWPEMQMKLAAEGFLIGLLESPDNTEKEKIRSEKLSENYNRIIEKLGAYKAK